MESETLPDEKDTMEQLLWQIDDLINSESTPNDNDHEQQTPTSSGCHEAINNANNEGNLTKTIATTQIVSKAAGQTSEEIQTNFDNASKENCSESMCISTEIKSNDQIPPQGKIENVKESSSTDLKERESKDMASQKTCSQDDQAHFSVKVSASEKSLTVVTGFKDEASCSKTDTVLASTSAGFIIMNKIPVVRLEKLAPGITSFKVKGDTISPCNTSEKQLRRSVSSTSKKDAKKSESKRKAWYDEDASLSDLSVSDISISDSEEIASTTSSDKRKVEKSKHKSDVISSKSKSKGNFGKKSDILEALNSKERKDNRGGRSESEKSRQTGNESKAQKKINDSDQVNSDNKNKRKLQVGNDVEVAKSKTDRKKDNGAEELPEGKKSHKDKSASKSAHHDSKHHQDTQSKEKTKESTASGLDRDAQEGDMSHQQSTEVSKSDRHRGSKRSRDAESENVKPKKTKTEISEDFIPKPNPVKDGHDGKEKVKVNKNIRYQLLLSPVSPSDLGNDAFRKFMNLAADCVIDFNKKHGSSSSRCGSVQLYFGDYDALHFAMQRLCQLPALAENTWVKGIIKTVEVKPTVKEADKEKWKKAVCGQLTFHFSTLRTEKIRQLISVKDRKKEGTKRKSAQVHRIPSSLSQEMLSLLFPFSIGVKISDPPEKGVKGPVDVEFESQEWMEAILNCFRDFSVKPNPTFTRPFHLVVKNFKLARLTPTDKKTASSRSPDKIRQQNKDEMRNSKGANRHQDELRDRGSHTRYPGAQSGGGPWQNRNSKDRSLEELQRRDQRKRQLGEVGRQGMQALGQSPDKRIRTDNPIQGSRGQPDIMWNRGEDLPQQSGPLEANKDAIRQLALARGLDPNNPGVIKLLEMTSQLEQLQVLVAHQTAEASSLGITGLPGQQALNVAQAQAQERQQVLMREQEAMEALRHEAVRQAQNMQAGRPGNLWLQREDDLRRYEEEKRRVEENRLAVEYEERRRQEEYQISRAQAHQLQELEGRMQSRPDIEHEREAWQLRTQGTRPMSSQEMNTGLGVKAGPVIQQRRNSPPKDGLLGPAPGSTFASHESRNIPSSSHGRHSRQDMERRPGEGYRNDSITRQREKTAPVAQQFRNAPANDGLLGAAPKTANIPPLIQHHSAGRDMEKRRREGHDDPINRHRSPGERYRDDSMTRQREKTAPVTQQFRNASRNDGLLGQAPEAANIPPLIQHHSAGRDMEQRRREGHDDPINRHRTPLLSTPAAAYDSEQHKNRGKEKISPGNRSKSPRTVHHNASRDRSRGPSGTERPRHNISKSGYSSREGSNDNRANRNPRRSRSNELGRHGDTNSQQSFTGRERGSGKRKSRWEPEQTRKDGSGVDKYHGFDPRSNDKPLEFHKPVPRMSTEQAVMRDMERTQAVLANTNSSRPFSGPQDKAHLSQGRTTEELGIPLQFGKNAQKITPQQIEEKKRNVAKEGMNARNRSLIGARDLGGSASEQDVNFAAATHSALQLLGGFGLQSESHRGGRGRGDRGRAPRRGANIGRPDNRGVKDFNESHGTRGRGRGETATVRGSQRGTVRGRGVARQETSFRDQGLLKHQGVAHYGHHAETIWDATEEKQEPDFSSAEPFQRRQPHKFAEEEHWPADPGTERYPGERGPARGRGRGRGRFLTDDRRLEYLEQHGHDVDEFQDRRLEGHMEDFQQEFSDFQDSHAEFEEEHEAKRFDRNEQLHFGGPSERNVEQPDVWGGPQPDRGGRGGRPLLARGPAGNVRAEHSFAEDTSQAAGGQIRGRGPGRHIRGHGVNRPMRGHGVSEFMQGRGGRGAGGQSEQRWAVTESSEARESQHGRFSDVCTRGQDRRGAAQGRGGPARGVPSVRGARGRGNTGLLPLPKEHKQWEAQEQWDTQVQWEAHEQLEDQDPYSEIQENINEPQEDWHFHQGPPADRRPPLLRREPQHFEHLVQNFHEETNHEETEIEVSSHPPHHPSPRGRRPPPTPLLTTPRGRGRRGNPGMQYF